MKKQPIILNFGKHKGKPLEEVQPSYLLWLYGEPWVREKYPSIYNYIKRHKAEIEADYNWDLVEEYDWMTPFDLLGDND